MDDVRGLFLGMPHGTTPAAVTANKNIIMCSFKSSGDIQKKEGTPVPFSIGTADGCFAKTDKSKCSDVVSVSCFGVRFSVMFHFMFVHYYFSSVWVAEWPPFGK